MEKLNKKIAMLLVVVFLVTVPLPSEVMAQQRANGTGMFIEDGCVFATRMGALVSMNAFAFGFIPGMQAVGIAFGGVALGMRLYTAFKC